MATKVNDSRVVSANGTYAPQTLTKFPEGGATFSARVSAGGSATVQLRGCVEANAKEILATFVLPCAGGAKNGDLFDSLPVFSIWDNFDWVVTNIAGPSTTVTLSCVGVGV